MFHAAAAKIDITPPLGAELQGYAGRYKGSEGILDPLYARCLVVESDNGRRWALISVDLISFENAEANRILCIARDCLGREHSVVSLAATHTHSGPATLRIRGFGAIHEAYLEFVVDAVGNMVKEAVQRLRPAHLVTSSGHVPFAVNRRKPMPDGQIALRPFPDGPVDHEVLVSAFVPDEAGTSEPIAILANYPCHPVTLGANLQISADFPGVYARTVEAVFPGSVAIFLNGASGDINPPAMDGPRTMEACGLSLAGETVKLVGAQMTSQIGAGVSSSEDNSSSKASAVNTSSILWAESRLELPLGALPSKAEATEQLETCERRLKELGDRSPGEARGWLALREWALDCLAELDGRATRPHRTEAIVQCVSIDESAFVFIPGELFVELGLAIKNQSPFRYTHVIGYANGWVGYLPTSEAVQQGGYEPNAYRYWQSRPLAPDAGERIVEEAVALLHECHHSMNDDRVDADAQSS